MAELPVKKKSRFPWWVWALVALLVVLLVWWLISLGDAEATLAFSGPETTYTEDGNAAAKAIPAGFARTGGTSVIP